MEIIQCETKYKYQKDVSDWNTNGIHRDDNRIFYY